MNGTNRARTYDPLLVRQMLSQLSYDPILTTPAGLEPATSAVTGRRSNQLSHEAIRITSTEGCTFKTSYRLISKPFLWSSLRPISNSQLHALLHFHLCPIYLVVFKGSYLLLGGDISS